MTTDQLLLFAILAATLALFVWNRWRYDLVAVSALLAAGALGLVEPGSMFLGLGHSAVVTVAAVLVMSRGLFNAGVVDSLARLLARSGKRPWAQVATLTLLVAVCSGFMNNVGALALLMPVAVWMARKAGRSPSFLLMPLAFGSLLGGTLTLIGTPPNIIVSEFRASAGGEPFGMFDFLPVGAGVTLLGVAFIVAVGWKLIPSRSGNEDSETLFEIGDYTTEYVLDGDSRHIGKTLFQLVKEVKDDAEIVILALVREEELLEMPPMHTILEKGDRLLAEGDSQSLRSLLDITDLKLAAKSKEGKNHLSELTTAEVIVSPNSMLVGATPLSVNLRNRYGINIIAVARQGAQLKKQLRDTVFVAGDILLVQGTDQTLGRNLKALGCLPLASRGIRMDVPRRLLLGGGIFAASVFSVTLGIAPVAPALTAGAVAMVVFGLVAPGEIYRSIDMRVIVLLAALLPVGGALESTGGSQLVADGLLAITGTMSTGVILAVLVISVMLLSNVVNNAAAAIIAAPVAIKVAQGLAHSPDPYLMAVVIGASCAFLTPVGHQSNTLVMEPGGYRFGDYWRMGLPLSLIVTAVAVPLIMLFWPV
jgi:di/tricarboxylate transporter